LNNTARHSGRLAQHCRPRRASGSNFRNTRRDAAGENVQGAPRVVNTLPNNARPPSGLKPCSSCAAVLKSARLLQKSETHRAAGGHAPRGSSALRARSRRAARLQAMAKNAPRVLPSVPKHAARDHFKKRPVLGHVSRRAALREKLPRRAVLKTHPRKTHDDLSLEKHHTPLASFQDAPRALHANSRRATS